MKLIPMIKILLLACLPFIGFAQQDSLKDRTKVTDFYISYGSSSFPVFTMSQENFKDIVPKSQLLSSNMMAIDFNNYNSATGGGFTNKVDARAPYLQAGITLRLRNREFRNAGPWLKLGMNYFSTTSLISTGIFTVNTDRDDTAFYSTSNLPMGRQTVTRNELTYVYTCESINFEGTLIYKLNPEGIFSLFGGPGAMLGANFGGKAVLNSRTQSTTTEYPSLAGPAGGSITGQTNSTGKETFDFGPNLSFGIFVNIGVDLRLGNKYEVIKNTHAFAELKPMFRIYGVKGVGLQNSILLVGNVGLRYEL